MTLIQNTMATIPPKSPSANANATFSKITKSKTNALGRSGYAKLPLHDKLAVFAKFALQANTLDVVVYNRFAEASNSGVDVSAADLNTLQAAIDKTNLQNIKSASTSIIQQALSPKGRTRSQAAHPSPSPTTSGGGLPPSIPKGTPVKGSVGTLPPTNLALQFAAQVAAGGAGGAGGGDGAGGNDGVGGSGSKGAVNNQKMQTAAQTLLSQSPRQLVQQLTQTPPKTPAQPPPGMKPQPKTPTTPAPSTISPKTTSIQPPALPITPAPSGTPPPGVPLIVPTDRTVIAAMTTIDELEKQKEEE